MQRFIALVVCACLGLQGCMSLQGVNVPRARNERADVRVGETVEVTTRDASPQRFKVTEVTDDALVGENVRVAYADMTSLQVRRGDEGQSGVLLYVLGGVVLVALAIIAIDNIDESGAGSTY